MLAYYTRSRIQSHIRVSYGTYFFIHTSTTFFSLLLPFLNKYLPLWPTTEKSAQTSENQGLMKSFHRKGKPPPFVMFMAAISLLLWIFSLIMYHHSTAAVAVVPRESKVFASYQYFILWAYRMILLAIDLTNMICFFLPQKRWITKDEKKAQLYWSSIESKWISEQNPSLIVARGSS